MMLPLDHVPFYRSSDVTLRAFHDLGFVCSPQGSYRSPQYPTLFGRPIVYFSSMDGLTYFEARVRLHTLGLPYLGAACF